MAKRHTSQDKKQKLGQYFTTRADDILQGWEDVVRDVTVVDPFAGGGDLLEWATRNGARETRAFDIEPLNSTTIKNDSILNPPDYSGLVVVTNPPYLSANKARGNKTPFEKWGASDLYKCHLASLSDADEAIEILPANFFCESRASARKRLFETHFIVRAKLWTQPIFDDTTSTICAVHLKRGRKQFQEFEMTILPSDTKINVILEERHNYLYGRDFFDYIAEKAITVLKTDIGMSPPNTRMVLGLLDNGRWPPGLSFNESEPVWCSPKSFTTYQLTLPDYSLTDEQQRAVVELFNHKLNYYRDQYCDLFLANYMGPEQKILSRDYMHRLLTRILRELNINPINGVWSTLFE